jgi:hypothetical protein
MQVRVTPLRLGPPPRDAVRGVASFRKHRGGGVPAFTLSRPPRDAVRGVASFRTASRGGLRVDAVGGSL